jgi:hypothetical protein
MFRLNEAVRLYQAQKPSPESASVAAGVITLSPHSIAQAKGIVATVAAVAISPVEPTDPGKLIEELREEGATLTHRDEALQVRPAHWRQMTKLSRHWKDMLQFLKTNENSDEDGHGRSA